MLWEKESLKFTFSKSVTTVSDWTNSINHTFDIEILPFLS